jgi:hypothetical protein
MGGINELLKKLPILAIYYVIDVWLDFNSSFRNYCNWLKSPFFDLLIKNNVLDFLLEVYAMLYKVSIIALELEEYL